MKRYYTTQDIVIDFGFLPTMGTLQLSQEGFDEIEDQILGAIDDCSADCNVTIEDMEIIEGIDFERDLSDGTITSNDWYHAIVRCSIAIAPSDFGSDGICINERDFANRLATLSYIGDFIDLSTLEIGTYDYDDYSGEYVEDEPDWDSMPGGHDYYDD